MGDKYQTAQCNEPTGQVRAVDTYGPSREEILNDIFRYHPPTPDSVPKYDNLRAAARYFAQVVLMNTPQGADQTAAIRKIREAVMTANAAVALHGVLSL